MRVESAEQGVRFEWGGEPDTVVRVGLLGPRERNYERLTLLHETIRSQRHGGVAWEDLELRERHSTSMTKREGRDPMLLWSGQFEDWQAAGLAFAVLCTAVGMDDDGVALEIEP